MTLAALALAGAFWLPGCAVEQPAEAPRNVILISIDTLRADRVGFHGYPRPTTPFLDRLARGSMVFERAYSTSSYTLPAHASLFLSQYPSAHGVDGRHAAIAGNAETLAERLRREGFRTAGFYAGPYLGPAFGFDRGFETYQPGGTEVLETRAPDVNRKALGWLASLAPEERYFLFLHYFDVHGPRIETPAERGSFARRELAPDAGTDFVDHLRRTRLAALLTRHGIDAELPPQLNTAYFRGIERQLQARGAAPTEHKELEGLRSMHFGSWLSEEEKQYVSDRYDDGVAFLDSHLRDLFQALDDRRRSAEAVVIVTSDHGELLYDHEEFDGHNHYLYEELIRVPLLLRVPAGSHRRVASPVSIVDVYPTILDALGLEPPAGLQGESLLAVAAGGSRRPPIAEVQRKKTLIRGDWKIVSHASDASAGTSATEPIELFRLDGAGAERTSLATEQPDRSRRMAADLVAIVGTGRRLRGQTEPASPALDGELLDDLRALGYVE